MTKQQAIKKGWRIGRTMKGGWVGRKNNSMEAATTLKKLLSLIASKH